MSIRLVDLCLRTTLRPSAKLVLLAICDAASDDGVAWPTQATLAAKASTTDRTVRNVLAELADMGVVSWEQRGLGRANRYQVHVDTLRRLAEAPDHPDRNHDAGPGGSDRNGGSGPDRKQVSGPDRKQGSGPITEPSQEPSREPSPAAPEPVPRADRRSDVLFETVAEVCGIDWRQPMTKSERGRLNRAVRELREVGATPDEVRRKAVAYRLRWPDIDLTPTALAANWTKVTSDLPDAEAAVSARRRMLHPPDPTPAGRLDSPDGGDGGR